MKIIVRTPNWLGDAVMALPTFTVLRAKFPDAEIVAACRAPLTAVFSEHPAINRVLAVPRATWALLKNAQALRRENFDLGILLTNSFGTAAWLAVVGARQRLGYARNARSWLLTNAVVATPHILAAHQAEYYLNLLSPLYAYAPLTMPHLNVSAAAFRAATEFLMSNATPPQSYAVIAPCSAFGAVKDWDLARYHTVAQRLVAHYDLTVFVVGTAAQREVIAPMCDARRIINTAGNFELDVLFGVLQAAKIFIGGDSGVAHAAAALSVPEVVIFGLTEPTRTAPLGEVNKIKLLGRGGETTPNLRAPQTLIAARAALNAITVEQVMQAITELWERKYVH